MVHLYKSKVAHHCFDQSEGLFDCDIEQKFSMVSNLEIKQMQLLQCFDYLFQVLKMYKLLKNSLQAWMLDE